MKSKDQILLEKAYQNVLKESFIDNLRQFIMELNKQYNKLGFKFSIGEGEISPNPDFENFKKVINFLYDGPTELATSSEDFLNSININGINFSLLNFDETKEPNYEEFYNSYLRKLEPVLKELDDYYANEYKATMTSPTPKLGSIVYDDSRDL